MGPPYVPVLRGRSLPPPPSLSAHQACTRRVCGRAMAPCEHGDVGCGRQLHRSGGTSACSRWIDDRFCFWRSVWQRGVCLMAALEHSCVVTPRLDSVRRGLDRREQDSTHHRATPHGYTGHSTRSRCGCCRVQSTCSVEQSRQRSP